RFVVRRRGPARRLLGKRSQAVGHRRRIADRAGSRRARDEHGGRAVLVARQSGVGDQRADPRCDVPCHRRVSARACSKADEVIPSDDTDRVAARAFLGRFPSSAGICPATPKKKRGHSACQRGADMRRLLLSLSAVALAAGLIAVPQASAQQSINFFVGGFVPRSPDLAGGVISGPGGRRAGDVLVRNGDFLTFDFKDFSGPIVGGGWTVGLADLFDAGIDVGFYQRTSPAVYTKFTHPDGGEIEQDLKLRIIPVTATIRFLPLGHHGPARPYIGAGVGIFAWRYTESGEFLPNDLSTVRNTFPVKG